MDQMQADDDPYSFDDSVDRENIQPLPSKQYSSDRTDKEPRTNKKTNVQGM